MRHLDAVIFATHLFVITREAGHVIMAVYSGGFADIQIKRDQSPVTEADFAAHGMLQLRLVTFLPECLVVSEEDTESLARRRCRGSFWLIDPLDGTEEFIAHNGEFTVNIALIEDDRSILGVVSAPAIDVLCWGGAGLGAYRCRDGHTVGIQVAESNSESLCRVVASKSHLNDQSLIDRLGQVSLLQAGSSLKFCRVTEGAADIYPRLAPTCEWDTASAQAVLEAAGGAVVDLHGRPLLYSKLDILNSSFIATRDIALIPV